MHAPERIPILFSGLLANQIPQEQFPQRALPSPRTVYEDRRLVGPPGSLQDGGPGSAHEDLRVRNVYCCRAYSSSLFVSHMLVGNETGLFTEEEWVTSWRSGVTSIRHVSPRVRAMLLALSSTNLIASSARSDHLVCPDQRNRSSPSREFLPVVPKPSRVKPSFAFQAISYNR
jgi:hypothetical protein